MKLPPSRSAKRARKACASLVVVWFAAATTQCGGISHRELGDGNGVGDTGPSDGASSGATGSGSTGSGASGSGASDGSGASAGSGASDGSGATGSGGSSDPGGSGASAGGSAANGGAAPGTDGGVVWDPNCYPPNAKLGAACTRDCDVECGLAAMGNKHCTCYDGTYVDCSCPRPAEYLGAPSAPYCVNGNGHTASIKGTACSVEWEQCIALDPVTGVTPRGCVCLPNELGGNLLTWFCGSTNRWFELAE